MKSTGIVRRIDELGRIVIPKEIRKNLKIKDGEPLEIFINQSEIILKKFSNMSDMERNFNDYVNIINDITGNNILITDRDKVISCNQKIISYKDKAIGDDIEDLLEMRTPILVNKIKPLLITQDESIKTNYYIIPLIVNSDVSGLIIMLSKNEINDNEKNVLDIVSKLITRQLE